MIEFSGKAATHLTIREQLLIALWAEYQRDIPRLSHIKCSELGVDRASFETAYAKLDNEGLLPDVRDICLNRAGLMAARELIPFLSADIGGTVYYMGTAAEIAEHYGAPLLAKFIRTIAKEIADKYKPQMD